MQFHLTNKQRKKRWFKFRLKIYSILALVALVVIGGAYIMKYSWIFKIQKLEVKGLEDDQERTEFLSSMERILLRTKTAKLLGKDNYFSWPDVINMPNLEYEQIIISKDFLGRRIKINVKKREKLGIWCVTRPNKKQVSPDSNQILDTDSFRFDNDLSEERCYWFDKKDGALINKSPSTKGQLIYKINEESPDFKSSGQKVMPANLFENFRKILIAFKNFNISIKSMIFDENLEELKIITKENTQIKFSLRFDPLKNSLPALAEILKGNPLSKIQYIDLTVENKIYLKNK